MFARPSPRRPRSAARNVIRRGRVSDQTIPACCIAIQIILSALLVATQCSANPPATPSSVWPTGFGNYA